MQCQPRGEASLRESKTPIRFTAVDYTPADSTVRRRTNQQRHSRPDWPSHSNLLTTPIQQRNLCPSPATNTPERIIDLYAEPHATSRDHWDQGDRESICSADLRRKSPLSSLVRRTQSLLQALGPRDPHGHDDVESQITVQNGPSERKEDKPDATAENKSEEEEQELVYNTGFNFAARFRDPWQSRPSISKSIRTGIGVSPQENPRSNSLANTALWNRHRHSINAYKNIRDSFLSPKRDRLHPSRKAASRRFSTSDLPRRPVKTVRAQPRRRSLLFDDGQNPYFQDLDPPGVIRDRSASAISRRVSAKFGIEALANLICEERAAKDIPLNEDDLKDRCLKLPQWEVWMQRFTLIVAVLTINISLAVSYVKTNEHHYLLGILVFMKSKDILSTLVNIVFIFWSALRERLWSPQPTKGGWILSLVCAYAETEEQIMKTVSGLVKSKTAPHKQAICIVLDGKPRDILQYFSTVKVSFRRSYVTWRSQRGEVEIFGGYIEKIPIVLIKKIKNAGKKDSLVLGHDMFNSPRADMPISKLQLRQEIWDCAITPLLYGRKIDKFDYIFCTDADSTIYETALQTLADALERDPSAIAGCGVLFAELDDPKLEWTVWHLFQQFQYTYGQYIRRQAESVWGRVTCLPGCITMIACKPEMGGAISEYAKPVTNHNLLQHQVQYLGTDRRLTWCMLSQGLHLRTIFVPTALSETVVPSSLSHYLSQRRRWASNAYFNDAFYAVGRNSHILTRLFAVIDLVRLSLVFYRVFNTVFFIRGMIVRFYIIEILPTLIITKTPVLWFVSLLLWKEPVLQRRAHKILFGMLVNFMMAPFLSVIVFCNVMLNMGSAVWGKTGASSVGVQPAADTLLPLPSPDKQPTWTPNSLTRTVKAAINGKQENTNHNRSQPLAKLPVYVKKEKEPAVQQTSEESAIVLNRSEIMTDQSMRTPGILKNGKNKTLTLSDTPGLECEGSRRPSHVSSVRFAKTVSIAMRRRLSSDDHSSHSTSTTSLASRASADQPIKATPQAGAVDLHDGSMVAKRRGYLIKGSREPAASNTPSKKLVLSSK